MKKLLSLVLCLMLAMSVFSFASAADEDVVIKWASPMLLETPEGPWIEKIIEEFNAMDNGYVVEGLAIPTNDLDKKLVAMATADDMPDIVTGYNTTLMTLVDMEKARPLTDLYDDDYISTFVPIGIETFTVDGVPYGHPFFIISQGVVYRKDLFEKDGVEVPTTWEELVAAAKKLTHDDQYGITLVGTRNGSGASRFQAIIRNFGVDEYFKDADGKWQTDIGSEKFITAVKAFTDLDLVDGVVPAGVIETGYGEAVGLLSSGKAAMLVTGSNALGALVAKVPELKGNLGSFPNILVERQVNTAAGSAIYITSEPDEVKDEGIRQFLAYLTGTENSLELAQLSGRLPVFTDTFNDPSVSTIDGAEGFLAAMTDIPTYVVPTIPGYGEQNDILGECYQAVFMGGSVEEACAVAQERAQEICDEANAEM